MPEQSLSNACIFSITHIAAFLCLGTLKHCTAVMLGEHLRQNSKHKKVENVALNKPQQGHLFTVLGLRQESECSLI